MYYKLDEDFKFIKTEAYVLTLENTSLFYNKLGRATEILTKFTGINKGTEEDPILFETTITTNSKKIKNLDKYVKTYKTWEGAKKGHDKIVEFVNTRLKFKLEDVV